MIPIRYGSALSLFADECAIVRGSMWALPCHPRWREVIWSASPARRHVPLVWLNPTRATAPEPERWVALARAVTTAVAGLPAFTLAASAVVVDQSEGRVTSIKLARTPELDELSSAVRDAMRGVYGDNAVCDPGELWQPHIPVPFHDPTTDPPDHAGDVIPLEGPVSGPVTDIIQVDQEFPPRDQPTSWGMVKTGGLIEVDHWVSRSLGERLGRSTWFPRLIGHRQHHHQLGTQLGAADPRPRNTTDDTGRRGWPPSSTASGRSCWSG